MIRSLQSPAAATAWEAPSQKIFYFALWHLSAAQRVHQVIETDEIVSLQSWALIMAIKAIFFDAAGTLIKPSRRVGESYTLVAQKYGVEVSSAAISERFRACFDAAPPLAFPGVSVAETARLEREWWKQLVWHIFEPWRPFEQFEEYFAELFDYFAQAESWTLYPEVPETISALKDRGLIVDVISNFDSRLIKILHGLGAEHWFEEIFISSRVGYAKPNRRIFEAALEKHGLNAGDALHVGDSERNDLGGAANAGVKGILIDRSGNETGHATHVSTLKEILGFLDSSSE
jgi:putative hydrolase of the HAD superfamily